MAKRPRDAEYKDRLRQLPLRAGARHPVIRQHNRGPSGTEGARRDVDASRTSRRREIKVLIHTGTGENYNADWGAPPTSTPMYLAMEGQKGLEKLDEKAWYGRMLIENVLAVEVPMISAVNGPCNIHSEVPLLGDIVLASEDAYFQDLAHFPRGIVPGDGQHVIWPGGGTQPGRGYMLLTGMKLGGAAGSRVGRSGAGASQAPACSNGPGSWRAASPSALPHSRTPAAVHAGPQARVPRRAGPWPRPARPMRSAVLPRRRGMEPLDRPWDKKPGRSDFHKIQTNRLRAEHERLPRRHGDARQLV